MEAIETTARFDGEGTLKLDNLPKIKNRKVKVIILLADNDNEEWFSVSSEMLAHAYSFDEPDYPTSMIKETNEQYGA